VEEAGEFKAGFLAEFLDDGAYSPARNAAQVGRLLLVTGFRERQDEASTLVVCREVVSGMGEPAKQDGARIVRQFQKAHMGPRVSVPLAGKPNVAFFVPGLHE
jgi:hypothetical protein